MFHNEYVLSFITTRYLNNPDNFGIITLYPFSKQDIDNINQFENIKSQASIF